MFQRLKGAIDNRIAEEQARQRQAQQAAQRPSPARKRPQNPNAAAQRPGSRPRDGSAAPGEKQPDPSDFVIGDEEVGSTPVIEKSDQLAKTSEAGDSKSEEGTSQQPTTSDNTDENAEGRTTGTNGVAPTVEQPAELPADVRAKLRKLEKLELRYGELLKAYRVAHARVQIIEPFEASLRENTPLTSIADPPALVEYLNQNKLKGDMVLDELKRVSSERDDFKKKFEQSERDTSALQLEVDELKTSPNAALQAPNETATREKPLTTGADTKVSQSATKDMEHANVAKSPTSTQLGSFSIFSPKILAQQEATNSTTEDLFSYDSEIPRLEQDLQDRVAEVTELNRQLVSVNAELNVARESTSSMVRSLETATQELNILRDEKHKLEALKPELEKRITRLENDVRSGSTQMEGYQEEAKELRAQKEAAIQEVSKLSEQIEVANKTKLELEAKLESEIQNREKLDTLILEKDTAIQDLKNSLATAKSTEQEQAKQMNSDRSSEKKLATMKGVMENLRKQLSTAETTVTELKKDIQSKDIEFKKRPSTKVFGFLDKQNDPKLSTLDNEDDVVDYLRTRYSLQESDISHAQSSPNAVPNATSTVNETSGNTTGGKKKNKKKKKGGKPATSSTEDAEPDVPIKVSEDLADMGDDTPPSISASSTATILALEQEVAGLKLDIESKANAIERLSKQIKDQEALQEEIETLRDDLLHQGEGHVEARDALKEAQQVQKSLQDTVEKLEVELSKAKKDMAAYADSEQAHKDLSAKFDELRAESETLQKDLNAAENLAAARFKDISDLKDILAKAQPELRQLRTEAAELASTRDLLKNREGDLKRLESRHEDLKSEMKNLSKRLGDKDSEIKELQTKIEQETKARNKVENELGTAQLDARVAENKRKDTSELLDQRQKDLAQSKEEVANLRRKIAELEDKVSDQTRDVSSLKEEVTLKTALHSSSQSLLQSLRDQTHELSTQARESSSRAESLEEELIEAQRMLTERTRESQTMRSLLDQAQNGVEARLRDMKERMEAALEDRDRVEDEANVRDRRLMREVEDARNKMRDSQKQLKSLEDERDDLETKSRDWRRRRDELEQQNQDANKDVEDSKQAMKGLRDALDESERNLRDVETQKVELRRQIDETNERVDKLTKANKSLSEDIKKLQEGILRKGAVKPAGSSDSGPRSSRTSVDSTRSPAPPMLRDSSASTLKVETPTSLRSNSTAGLSQGTVDYVYLKNVLLQFMEQKDKSHQRQLVPVLGMLLHFNRQDEQKWMAAISAK